MSKQRWFGPLFAEAFQHVPRCQSERGHALWAELELVSDGLAGPLYTILTQDNCAYVYHDGRFPGVVDAASFGRWASGLAGEYAQRVAAFVPADAAEAADKRQLEEVAAAMMEAAEVATELEAKRRGEG